MQLTCIPDGITTIEADAFRGNTNLAYVHIPDSVTSIGDYGVSRDAATFSRL